MLRLQLIWFNNRGSWWQNPQIIYMYFNRASGFEVNPHCKIPVALSGYLRFLFQVSDWMHVDLWTTAVVQRGCISICNRQQLHLHESIKRWFSRYDAYAIFNMSVKDHGYYLIWGRLIELFRNLHSERKSMMPAWFVSPSTESKMKIILRVPCEGNYPVTGRFPSQRATNAESVYAMTS